MGELSLPAGSRVYLDTAPIIYSVEQVAEYRQLLRPLWQAAKANEIEIVTSELTLLETLVQPLRRNNKKLALSYETLLTKTEIALFPITLEVIHESAVLRAKQNFKTPDAIHCATASVSHCDYLVANDTGFRRLDNIDVIILADLL